MKLLIVESPSKAKTVSQYLGKDYIVTSSYGHIRSLPSETGSVKPEENFSIVYKEQEQSHRAINEIVKYAKQCNEIYLATDLDREGEAISWHIMEVLKEKKALQKDVQVKRIVFHEITKKAILEAIDSSRDINMSLVHAQQARQALDYLVGFTLSPVLWRKLPGSRSAGRVQSVALRVICEREGEIEKFKSQEYWSIEADFADKNNKEFSSWLTVYNGNKLDKFDLNNEKSANNVVEELKSESYKIAKVEKKQSSRSPAPPFTTSTLLQEAARKFGFSTKKTSKLAQALYEGIELDSKVVGLITYMRTDSVSLSQEALDSIRDHIGTNMGKDYLPDKPRFYKTKTKNAQEAHEAIRPTNVLLSPEKVKSKLDNDHFRLYELIWKRAVASQVENTVLEIMTVDITDSSEKNNFRTTGSVVLFDGYMRIYSEGKDDDDEKSERILPKLSQGDIVKLKELLPVQHFTQPPHRYTEAALVKKMEELGIGRPSTYPTVISILQEREYVIVDKKRFMPEPKGRLVCAFLTCYFAKYVEYDFTAKLENELDDISNGEVEWKSVLRHFWDPFKIRTDEVLGFQNVDIVHQMEKELASYIFDDAGADQKCPTCNDGKLELKTGRFGAFVGCSNYPECRHTKQIGNFQKEDSQEQIANSENSEFPKIVGADSDGAEISIRKGPYGLYLQSTLGEKIKRVGLAKNADLNQINLAYAQKVLALPRILGEHPDGGKIKAGVGRFGPFIEFGGKFKSLKVDDPITISLERAIVLVEEMKNNPNPGRTRFVKKSPAATKAAKKTKAKPKTKAASKPKAVKKSKE